MTKPPKPPVVKSKKGIPPSSAATRGNLTKPDGEDLVDLNFKVTRDTRREIKQFALDHHMSAKEVLLRALEVLKEKA